MDQPGPPSSPIRNPAEMSRVPAGEAPGLRQKDGGKKMGREISGERLGESHVAGRVYSGRPLFGVDGACRLKEFILSSPCFCPRASEGGKKMGAKRCGEEFQERGWGRPWCGQGVQRLFGLARSAASKGSMFLPPFFCFHLVRGYFCASSQCGRTSRWGRFPSERILRNPVCIKWRIKSDFRKPTSCVVVSSATR